MGQLLLLQRCWLDKANLGPDAGALAGAPHLEELRLTNRSVTDDAVVICSSAKRLRTLELRHSPDVGDACADGIIAAAPRQLSYIHLHGTAVSRAARLSAGLPHPKHYVSTSLHTYSSGAMLFLHCLH